MTEMFFRKRQLQLKHRLQLQQQQILHYNKFKIASQEIQSDPPPPHESPGLLKLVDQNKELRDEVHQLRGEVQQLRDEVKQLGDDSK
jgi:cell division protein FtsB